MTNRNPVVVVLLALITFGIYGIVWEIMTAREMRAKGADIPNAILIFIPIVHLYWLWKYSQGVELVTKGQYSASVVFLLFFFTGIGGYVVSQMGFNNAGVGGSNDQDISAGVPVAAAPLPSAAPTPNFAPVAGGIAGAAVTPAAVPQNDQPTIALADTPVEPTPVTPPTVDQPAPEPFANPDVQPPVAEEPIVQIQPDTQVITPSEPQIIEPTPVQQMPPLDGLQGDDSQRPNSQA